jgi:hypothetical protein
MEGRNWRDLESQRRLIRGDSDDPPCPDEKLPPGWSISEINGEIYYYKPRTGKKQYNHPNNCNKDDSPQTITDIPTPIPEDQSTGALTITEGLKKRYSSNDISKLEKRISLIETDVGDLGDLISESGNDIEDVKNLISNLEKAAIDDVRSLREDVEEIKSKIYLPGNQGQAEKLEAFDGGGMRNTNKRGNTKKRGKTKKRKMSKKRKKSKKRKMSKKRN